MMPATRAELFARWSGVSIILFSALARLMSSPSRIPYWDIDPLTSWSPDTTRTPAMSLLFDALVWLAASAIIWAEGRAGRGIAWRTGLLALVGCVGVALHGWVLTPLTAIGGTPPTHGDFQSMILGSSWASAIIGAWALSMAARDSAVMRTATMTLLGVVIVLGAKGAMQVFIEHPRLVADFNAKKDEMLAAQGFQPGSVSARLFERRLVQAEATGWFGLSNVYGSIMAAGCAAFLSLAISATRSARSSAVTTGEAGLLWLTTAIAATGLALSGSKGAISAGALGCTCVITAHWIGAHKEAASESSKRRMLLRYAPIILPILALLAICLRGLIGERIGELSLYFRWQYLLAAARIILAHPIFGTGPAGFKDQYLLHKEPTNPEEIDSPHCLPMDWLATLGFFGAAWVALWVVWLYRCGMLAALSKHGAAGATTDATALGGSVMGRERDSGASARPHHAPEAGCVVAPPVVIFASLGFSWWCEWAAMLPEMLVVYALAGLAWWLLARTGSRLAEIDPRALSIALFGAAVVLGTHCMIEVTGVFTSSVGWATACIALAGTPKARPTQTLAVSRLLIATGLGVASIIAGISADIFQFEERLYRASLRVQAAMTQGQPPDVDILEQALGDLISAYGPRLGFLVPLPDTLDLSTSIEWRVAVEKSSKAPAEFQLRTRHIISNAQDRATRNGPKSVIAWGRYARLVEARAAMISNPDSIPTAINAWLRATPLDPHGLTPPLHLARLYAQLDQPEEAARWARRALEVHANLHLDPLKGLTDAEKAEMKRLAASAQFDENRKGWKPVPPSN